MTCQFEKDLQAYLDGELNREERKELSRHLQECAYCRNALKELKNLNEYVDDILSGQINSGSCESISARDVDLAWERFQSILHEKKPTCRSLFSADFSTPSTNPSHKSQKSPSKRSWFIMIRKYRKLFSGLAAAVIFALFLMIPQVQTLASELLALFRTNKIEMVKLTPEDLHQIKSFFYSGEKGEMSLKELGRIWVESEKGIRQQYFSSPAEAQAAGIDLPPVPEGYLLEGIHVQSSAKISMELNTEKANKLMEKFGSDALFDPGLNGKKFSVIWPGCISADYRTASGSSEFDHFHYTTMLDSPQIEAPSVVDAENLRAALLQAPFIPERVRSQLATIEDWQTTLPVPYVEGVRDVSYTEKLSVNGKDGVFMAADKGHSAVLLWHKNGKLHVLYGNTDKQDTALLKNNLIKLAAVFN